MRLVSYDDGRVGYLAGRQVISLPVRTMRDVIASWNAGRLPVPSTRRPFRYGMSACACRSLTRRRSSRLR